MKFSCLIFAIFSAILLGCSAPSNSRQNPTKAMEMPEPGPSQVKFSKVVGWGGGQMPIAPDGFTVTKFAHNIKSPRNFLVTDDGNIFVALSNSQRTTAEQIANAASGKAESEVPGKSANTILLYRDQDKDGVPESVSTFLTGLNQPFGMEIIGNWFYVANTDGLWRYPFDPKSVQITGKGAKIVDLPAGGYNNHWTRNLITNRQKTKIYISVGSATNIADRGMDVEHRRASILEVNPDGSGEIIYASGLRNPVGLAWEPNSSVLWTAVNERDGLGDDLVPDYITSVKKGGFYGWPFAYFGQHEDPRLKGRNPEAVQKTLVPDVSMGAHTASLGLAFYTAAKFPKKYQGGAFIGQHGSWNRSVFSGYKVAFVPFKNGKPAGKMEDFLTGFIADAEKGTVYGRPVGVALLPNGSILVADDVSGTIWKVSATR